MPKWLTELIRAPRVIWAFCKALWTGRWREE